MTTGPGLFDDPQLDEAWHAYASCDRRLAPPPDLEARTFARCQANKVSECHGATAPKGQRARVRARWPVSAAAMAVAATIVVVIMPASTPLPPASTVLETRALAPVATFPAVSPERPVIVTRQPRPEVSSDLYVQHVELPSVLMMFDAGPVQDNEPLQLVRLRLPREALQALGLALLEPDATGVVDVDVLIGEDGLPRDIRRVRMGRENR